MTDPIRTFEVLVPLIPRLAFVIDKDLVKKGQPPLYQNLYLGVQLSRLDDQQKYAAQVGLFKDMNIYFEKNPELENEVNSLIAEFMQHLAK